MIAAALLDEIRRLLERRGESVSGELRCQSVSGGCINQAYRLSLGSRSWFVKTNSREATSVLRCEANALKALAESSTIRVPQVIGLGQGGGRAFLVLEWLDLQPLDDRSGAVLGAQLAQLHQPADAPEFGWIEDNVIGSTPQINTPTSSWCEFFCRYRLEHQFEIARANGFTFPDCDRTLAAAERVLRRHRVQPALLHGDLWAGNAAATSMGEPVIFDPASYLGDAEVDLAMTTLFGRFPEPFYAAYSEVRPSPDGWEMRTPIYNLYHALNHLNLFGAGYHAMVRRLMTHASAALD